MFQQDLRLPALHLRTQMQLRPDVRVQRAGAPLIPRGMIEAPSGASPLRTRR